MKDDIKPGGFRLITVLILLGLLAVTSFTIRSINGGAIFSDDEVRFLGGDSHYHMRRATLAAYESFKIPAHDPAMNHPQGLYCRWPPLFDQMIAGFAFLLSQGSPTTPDIHAAGALLPPLLGAITVVAIFFLARMYLHTGGALIACALLMLLPYHIQVSVAGRADHHVAVVLAGLLFFLSMAEKRRSYTVRTTVVRSSISGALLALTLSLWTGSLLFVLISILYLTTIMLLNSSRRHTLNQLTIGGMCMFGVALLIILPLCKQSHWGRSGILMWTALSDFHILLLFGCSLGVLALRMLIEIALPSGSNTRLCRLVATLILVAIALLGSGLLLGSGFLAQTAGGPAWLFKKDRFLVHIVENMPLTASSAMQDFSLLVFIFPLLTFFLVRHTWKTGKQEAAVFLATWFTVIGGSTIAQERFADLFSVTAAILIAYFLVTASNPSRWASLLRKRVSQSRAIRLILTLVLFCGLALGSLWPVGKWVFHDYWHAARAPHRNLDIVYHMCNWLRDNTPPAFSPGSDKANYSILASWSLGNTITHVGERANVANNIGGYGDTREANIAPYRFFVSQDMDEAEAILQKYDVRYIVAEEMIMSGHFARVLDILEMDHDDFFESVSTPRGIQNTPTARFMKTMTTQLYIMDGVNLPQFSLVYESPYRNRVAGRAMGSYKIFEYRARDE